MIIRSTEKLRQLTGNYYANNDFSKVESEIVLATDELRTIVGNGVIDYVEQHVTDLDEQVVEFVDKVARPVAIIATLRMYRKNDLSHEDDGRKFKVSTDGTDKIPWEWQLDRDDAMHLEEYYRAVDALIRYLNEKQPKEWTDSDQFKQANSLIIRSGREFDYFYAIDKSERTYMLLQPFIREVQIRTVSRAYGANWDTLMNLRDVTDNAFYAACKAVALLAMSLAFRRLPLSVIPVGVVKQYQAKNGMNTTKLATLEDIERMAGWLEADGAMWVSEMKEQRDGKVGEYSLLPENDPKNKYVRL